MKKFEVVIEETTVYEVESSSEKEAIESTMEKYKKGELNPNESKKKVKQISVDECLQWFEF